MGLKVLLYDFPSSNVKSVLVKKLVVYRQTQLLSFPKSFQIFNSEIFFSDQHHARNLDFRILIYILSCIFFGLSYQVLIP